MPKPVALTPGQAKRSLAHRLGPRVDRVRQIATKMGLRPYRVCLVWTVFSGTERGEGRETEIKRIEILPTPRVESMENILLTAFTIGSIPIGMLRLRLVSATYTLDQLTGHWVPEPHEERLPENHNFFYEIFEDGRGDPVPLRQRFRLAAKPHRRAGSVSWDIMLERLGTDHDATILTLSTQCEG